MVGEGGAAPLVELVLADGATVKVAPGWLIEPDQRMTTCRSCQALIYWARHSGTWKASPFDPDGTNHFATCPDAQQWRHKRG